MSPDGARDVEINACVAHLDFTGAIAIGAVHVTVMNLARTATGGAVLHFGVIGASQDGTHLSIGLLNGELIGMKARHHIGYGVGLVAARTRQLQDARSRVAGFDHDTYLR